MTPRASASWALTDPHLALPGVPGVSFGHHGSITVTKKLSGPQPPYGIEPFAQVGPAATSSGGLPARQTSRVITAGCEVGEFAVEAIRCLQNGM